MTSDQRGIAATDYLTMSEPGWEQTRSRARVISQLAQCQPATHAAVDKAAQELGVSSRQVYGLLDRYRQVSGEAQRATSRLSVPTRRSMQPAGLSRNRHVKPRVTPMESFLDTRKTRW